MGPQRRPGGGGRAPPWQVQPPPTRRTPPREPRWRPPSSWGAATDLSRRASRPPKGTAGAQWCPPPEDPRARTHPSARTGRAAPGRDPCGSRRPSAVTKARALTGGCLTQQTARKTTSLRTPASDRSHQALALQLGISRRISRCFLSSVIGFRGWGKWQNSQELPLAHSPFAKKRQGREQTAGWPMLPQLATKANGVAGELDLSVVGVPCSVAVAESSCRRKRARARPTWHNTRRPQHSEQFR